MSRFSREQLETLTKVFADSTTNHVAAAGEVTVRELAQTALDALDRIDELERQLADAIPLDAFTLPGVSGGMEVPPEGHWYGDACLPNGHGVYWTAEIRGAKPASTQEPGLSASEVKE